MGPGARTANVIVLFVFGAGLSCALCRAGSQTVGFCVSIENTPVLNASDFESVFGGADGKSISLDSRGHMRELEFIAFPGTVFKIHERIASSNILRVSTTDYPFNGAFYIDKRFVEKTDFHPGERKKAAPPKAEVIERLKSMLGQKYLWGGNTGSGVPRMLDLYGPEGAVTPEVARMWELRGVDCSGLLYFAADGYTPRNTSALVSFGRGLDIAGLSVKEIKGLLRPLDLIVWVGHVIIMLDGGFVIESAADGGVRKSAAADRLEELFQRRSPADGWHKSSGAVFVVRRWID